PARKLVGRNGTEPVQVNGRTTSPSRRRTTSVLTTTIRKRLQSDEGFTLVELLVVILIIGILAAIAIPSFLNQKGKGEDAAAKSSARSGQTALETYYTDNQSYDCHAVLPNGCDTALHGIERSLPTYSTANPTPAGDMVLN